METTEVVVVGAGPTGLAMAGVLADRGVDHVLVDRAAAGATTSRAAVVHAATLEALGDAAATLIEHGLPVTSFAVRNRDHLLVELDMGTLRSPYPYALMIPQDATERLLTERLAALGSAPRRGLTATALRVDNGRVDNSRGDDERATVELTDDAGTTHSVSARYVVGADGMHGTVRDLAGIGFDGSAYRQSFVLADVEVDWSLPSRQIQLFLSDEGLVVVAPLPGGRHRVVATMDDAPERPGVDDIARLLGARADQSGCPTSAGARDSGCTTGWRPATAVARCSWWATPPTCTARRAART